MTIDRSTQDGEVPLPVKRPAAEYKFGKNLVIDGQSTNLSRSSASKPSPGLGVLQRKCACGGSNGLTGSCADCEKKKLLGQSLQTKLRNNEPGDEYEQESDRVAEQVMRMAEPERHRTEAPRVPLVQRRVNGSHADVGDAPSIVHEVLSSPGEPLDAATRAFFEPRFAHDLRHVRIHSDLRAAQSARSVNARAYTVGRDVILGAGEYAPKTGDGQRLLAHELTHVAQQSGNPVSVTGAGIANGVFSEVQTSATVPAIQRLKVSKPDEPAEAYIADVNELRVHFEAMTAEERRTFIAPFFLEVQNNWTNAEASGLTARLQGAPAAAAQMASNPVRPLAGIAHSGVESYAYRFQFSGTTVARQLVRGETTLAVVAKTPESALRAVSELRRLNDVLTRALSAESASLTTGTPMADVLAIYRAEGGLGVPPSAESLAQGIPSGTKDEPALLRPPNLSHLVWLVSTQSVEGQDDYAIKEEALSHWFVQLGGLDEVGLLPDPKWRNFPQWSSKNWLAATDFDPSQGWTGGRATQALALWEAYQRWKTQMDNLELRRLGSAALGASAAVMVAPRDPQTLISGVLGEAVMRHRAGGKLTPLLGALPAGAASPDLTPGLAYLAYNTGVDNFKRMLAGAAVAASRTTGNRYRELRAALAGNLDLAGLRTMLTKINEIDKRLDAKPPASERPAIMADMRARMGSMWIVMSVWLRADIRHLELLGEFVETADRSLWSSWATGDFSPRGNMSRYNVMRAFYQTL